LSINLRQISKVKKLKKLADGLSKDVAGEAG
jgi:hypothetical protein